MVKKLSKSRLKSVASVVNWPTYALPERKNPAPYRSVPTRMLRTAPGVSARKIVRTARATQLHWEHWLRSSVPTLGHPGRRLHHHRSRHQLSERSVLRTGAGTEGSTARRPPLQGRMPAVGAAARGVPSPPLAVSDVSTHTATYYCVHRRIACDRCDAMRCGARRPRTRLGMPRAY